MVFPCGRRFGKTIAAAKEIECVLARPNTRSWVVAPNHSLTNLVFREVWKTAIFQKKIEVEARSNREGKKMLQTPWKSTLEAKSAENPDSLIGEGLDIVVIDEAARINAIIWDELLAPTLADKNGIGIFISTPRGYNHFHDKFKLGFSDPLWYSFQAPSWINPYVYPEGYDTPYLQGLKRNMPKESFEQEFGAQFTTYAGKVYPFSRYEDVGNYPYKPDLPTYCSIDFGFRMPAVGWFQTEFKDNHWHIYQIDEIIHKSNIKTEHLAQMIQSKPYHVSSYFGDPAGSSIQGSGSGDINTFKNAGIKIKWVRDKLSRDIETGIDLVRGYIENANGERFLHVDKKCKGSIDDYEAYHYPESDKKGNLNIPVKDNYHDHGCDMLRYFFLNRFPLRQFKFTTWQRSW